MISLRVRDRHNQQSLFNVLGSMFHCCNFLWHKQLVFSYTICFHGADCSVSRKVFWDVCIMGLCSCTGDDRVPYLFAQSLAFVCITYPNDWIFIGQHTRFSATSIHSCGTLMYFTYLGMLLVAVTPSFPVAAILQSAFYTMFNLFAGFLIPKPKIPNWWIWLYYLTPTSWSLSNAYFSIW
ncbi:putative ABC-2 type transporter [Helianthus annuus]|uniref:ABC-2 type transporter n=1 Tax=Helianthus annuus TaxID=4232 RepID=A0A9K3J756_HELAN|nr:putative ABC-2 type transporter [Helianthus annuus]